MRRSVAAGWALLLVPANALSTSTPPAASAGSTARVLADVQAHLAETGGHAQQGVYQQQYSAGVELDQAAFRSGRFWADVTAEIPRWRTDPKLKRFRQFCEHLAEREPGVDVFLENGQQILSQYEYPGLDGPRSPYPAADFAELAELKARLERDVAPVARAELAALLDHKPVVSDDAETAPEDGDSWQRAAWYGWQFMSLRGAKRFMPGTAAALRAAAGGSKKSGPAHRFVGLARQKANCRGLEHSDGRNYMLSTLVPLRAPAGQCGIVVGGETAPIEPGGDAVVLDNTFVHHVYNNDPRDDRFVLMCEVWHPSLSSAERDALATLFAVKDRFTVLELELAPWGYDDDDLGAALQSGAVRDLDFWKEIGASPERKAGAKGAARRPAKSAPPKKRTKAKGFAKKR